LRGKEEIMDQSGSGSEQVEDKSGNEQEINNEQQATKKKRYHRHTARQIQEMEAYNTKISLFLYIFARSLFLSIILIHTVITKVLNCGCGRIFSMILYEKLLPNIWLTLL
jgi:hypothetical protein